ncbi:hypothetical protein [Bacillus sp. EB01]|uniref:hypothetical protein n=1 Tax=Bacillus sp. EB01 TaxID=1347086 RepID=UPI0005C45E4E|nr:hypothetical protein [Bacillus sp. EB01]
MIKIKKGIIGEPSILYNTPREKAMAVGTGIWLNGKVQWNFDNKETIMYEEQVTMRVTEEKPHSKVSLHSYHVINHSSKEIQLKLLSMNYLKTIRRDHFAFISPADDTSFHLAGDQMFMINGQTETGDKWESTIVPSWIVNSEQIWASLEKGQLKYQPTAKGNPATLLSASFVIPAGMTALARTWTIAGSDKNELINLNNVLLKNRLAFPIKK